MKAKKQEAPFDFVVADFRDTEGLLNSLAKVLRERHNVYLNLHNLGDDNYHVTVAERRVTSREYREFVKTWA